VKSYRSLLCIACFCFLVLAVFACASGGSTNGQRGFSVEETEIDIFPGMDHTENINAIAFSPDGKFLVSGSNDNTVKIWDTESGRELRTFIGHDKEVLSVAFSPDGKIIASGSKETDFRQDSVGEGSYLNGTLKIWDVQSGKELFSIRHGGFQKNAYGIENITFSPDGTRVAITSAVKHGGYTFSVIRIYNTKTGNLLNTLYGDRKIKSNYFYSLDFSPDGKNIIATEENGYGKYLIRILNINTGKVLLAINPGENKISSAVYCPDGKKILVLYDTSILIYDLQTGKQIHELKTEDGYKGRVSYSPDGKYILSKTKKNKINIYNADNYNLVRTIIGYDGDIMSVIYSPDSRYIAACINKKIKIWDAQNGRELRTLSGNADISNNTSIIRYFSNNRDILIVNRYSGNISILNSSNGKIIQSFQGLKNNVATAELSPDGKQVVICYYDKREVKSGNYIYKNLVSIIWDMENGKQVRTLTGLSEEEISYFNYSPDGKYLIATAEYHPTTIWDVSSGEVIATLPKVSFSLLYWNHWLRFSPNGKYFGYAGVVWDTQTGKQLWPKNNSGSQTQIGIFFSPDGRYFITPGFNDIYIYNIETLDVIHKVKCNHVSASHGFDPNGKHFIFSEYNKLSSGKIGLKYKYLNIETGKITQTFNINEAIRAASDYISPDGKFIIKAHTSLGNRYARNLELIDVNNGKLLKKLFTTFGEINILFSPDGNQLTTVSREGIRFWNTDKYEEIVRFISFSGSDSQLTAASRGLTVETETASSTIEGEWLSITPDGYYQASPRGDRFLNVRVNNTVSGIDSYRSVFYNPDVVQARLQGKPDPASKANVTIQQAANFLPPQVTIKSPSTFTSTNTANTNLSVTVTDQNQSIKNIKIFVNGRAIARNELSVIKGSYLQAEKTSLTVTGNQKTVNFELPVTLDPGRNLIEVVAFNGYSESARLSPIEVTYNAPAGQQRQLPNLWVLAVGVNGYDNAGLRLGGMGNLRFAVADAKRLVESLKSQEGKRYAKVNSLIIGDGESVLPAAANIRQNLSFLEQAGERDVVLLFLAGHGLSAQDGKFFFLPKDAVVSGTSGNWRVDEKLAISGEEITAVLEGQGNRLLFIDACQSGGVDNNRMIRTMMESNAFVFAASQGNEVSYEDPRWGGGHGVFTYNILNALKGAPNALAEGNVSVRSMSGFVSLEVPKATQGFPQGQQNPKVYSLLFSDFPLAVIK